MKTFLYARVSTAERASNAPSIEVQQKQGEAYAMSKGWTVEAALVEIGVSGQVPFAKRPQGSSLLVAVAQGDAIIVSKLDRAFRNARDALTTLEALRERGVSFHVLDIGGDITANGIGTLTTTILAAVAESDGEHTRDPGHYSAGEGVYAGGTAPFGFDVVRGRLIVNPEQQEAIKDMQTRRYAGETLAKIAAAHGMHVMTIKRILDRTDAT